MNLGPIEVAELLLARARESHGKPKWNPYWTHLPDGKPWTVAGRLFQAAEWRRYAGAWDGIPIDRGFVGWPHRHRVVIDRAWVESILRVSKAECIRRARANHYLAKRIRRAGSLHQQH